MSGLRGTLVTDGSSDKVLLRPLEWLLNALGASGARLVWAELRTLIDPPEGLGERLRVALEMYDCDLLFVHRDAEGQSIAERHREVLDALDASHHPHVCVVPVRMTEAWLMFDEAAVRQAAGNPGGRSPLDLPPMNHIEKEPDPKGKLHQALRVASGLPPGRQKRFNPRAAVYRVAETIRDYSPLRELPAFREVEQQVVRYLEGRAAEREKQEPR